MYERVFRCIGGGSGLEGSIYILGAMIPLSFLTRDIPEERIRARHNIASRRRCPSLVQISESFLSLRMN